ncbi:SIMPL domain-containing protein [Pseudopedobacter beijingensis]|uniref:SIMPL domain-containing protein n=1 Tax=Pseudopedobacter beijingensis TaxID=1207056 RepID=A0ABW4I721_9SPHI
MKKLIIAAIIACTSISAFAQNIDLRKKVEVNGTAETEITPDEIYISISLKEYFRDNKRKTTIVELEKQLQTAVTKAGIAKEDFMINNVSSSTDYWNKKKDPSFLASKQYKLKVKDLNSYNQIIESVDPKGIASTHIDSYSHSNIVQLKNDLRVKALMNAKNKAKALTDALGDKLGSVLIIQDYNSDYNQPVREFLMAAKAMDSSGAGEESSDIEFKKIKLQYSINATFEIK